jgi:UDP-N-acetylmuramyl pentapeptide phosphotransferase/UDP-N-acetylglucosamine-1-phosphate transferase
VVTNFRGVHLRAWLGPALWAGLAIQWGLIAGTAALLGAWSGRYARLLGILGCLLIVFLAGLYDDLRVAAGKGLLGHFAELMRGRFTPGMVKLFVIVVAALFVCLVEGERGLALVLAVPVVAGSANVWNLLDIRPGRALKWFLAAMVPLLVWGARGAWGHVAVAALAMAVILLWFDLREWGVLGDSGSNVLGFVVGIGLFLALPTWGLAIALGVILLIHLLAETITLSRMLRGVPPLRWFDDLGRIRPTEPRNRDSEATSS